MRMYLAWRRPTLAGAKPQLPSALESLTSVFGMGTGVTSPLLLPDLKDVDRSVLFQNVLLLKDKLYYMQFPEKMQGFFCTLKTK